MNFSGYNRMGQSRVGCICTKSLKYKKVRNMACIFRTSKRLRNLPNYTMHLWFKPHFLLSMSPMLFQLLQTLYVCPDSYPKNLSATFPHPCDPSPKPQKRQTPSIVEEKKLSADMRRTSMCDKSSCDVYNQFHSSCTSYF